MLARTILATLVSAACFATVNAQTCSATNAVCCQQLQDPDNLNADALNLLRLLNINPNTLTGAVGLTCKRLTEACFACLLSILERTHCSGLHPDPGVGGVCGKVLVSALTGFILPSLRISYS